MIAIRPRSARGFSLIELGIVIAVIAVLSSVVLLGSGYINAAKARNAIEMVPVLRSAAKQFAARKNSGLTYGTPGLPNCVSMNTLANENLVSSNLKTPWGSRVAIQPEQGVDPKCAGYTCVRICLETPDETGCTTCNDIAGSFKGNSIQVTCGGGACSLGGSCVLSLVSR